MRSNFILLALFAIIFCGAKVQAQKVAPNKTGTAVDHVVVIPSKTKDYDTISQRNFVRNPMLRIREYPYIDIAYPKGDDPVWQKNFVRSKSTAEIISNWQGQKSPWTPPDCNGVVGLNHYIQTINDTYTIYDKATGAKLASGYLSEFFPSELT